MKDIGILLLIFIFIIYNIYFNETFTTENYPYIEFDSDKKINKYLLELTKNKTLKQIPNLEYVSKNNCPIMYKIFKDIKSETNIEKIEAIRLRNKIQSIFYNTDKIISVDYQIINITKQEINNDDKNIPNFNFKYLEDDDSDTINEINYIDNKDIHLKLNQKNNFGIDSSFKIEDLIRFMDYCFTILTYKIEPLRNFVLNNSAMYVMKCPICNSGQTTDNGAYNIVPVRIVQQCIKDNKEFTRAKCTKCCSNILVYFDYIPNNYLNYYKLENNDFKKIENINFK